MKCSIDAKLWKGVVGCLAEMKDSIAFKFTEKGLEIRQMDASHTVLIDLELPRSVWKEYEPAGTMVLSAREMELYLKRLKSGDVIVLSGDLEKEPRLQMGIRSRMGFRRFGLAVMEVGSEEEDPAPIKHFASDVKAKISTQALDEAVADAQGIIGGKLRGEPIGYFTVEARSKPERFVIWATEEGTFRSSWYEFVDGLSLMELECSAERMRSVYGIAQVKAVLSGAVMSNIVKVEYSEDLPARFTYQLAFPGKLMFWVAPRIMGR